jgi:hypothetical protein
MGMGVAEQATVVSTMRRLGQGLAATVALVAVLTALIGVCPCAEQARSADDHDCCTAPPGFRAAVEDCCSSPGDAPLVVTVPCVPFAAYAAVPPIPLRRTLAASPSVLSGAGLGPSPAFPSSVLRI